jgi:hypothetical protein
MKRTNLSATIDRLGYLKAQIAALKIEEDALKESLGDLDVGNYEGEAFRLAVTAPKRETLSDELKASIKAVVAEYRDTLSPQYRTAHIKLVPVPTLTVRARSGASLAA